MTAHEHPISDAELDAVLGAATARLNDTLARTVDIDAGLAAITQTQTTPAQTGSPDATSGRTAARPPEGAGPASTGSAHSVSALITDALVLIERFPPGRGRLGRQTAALIDKVGLALGDLDSQLARRALTRQEARIMLDNVNQRLVTISHVLSGPQQPTRPGWVLFALYIVMTFTLVGGAILGVLNAVALGLLTSAIAIVGVVIAVVLPKRLDPVSTHSPVFQQFTACKDLRGHLKRLGVAVEKLFDDAEDRSVTGCH